jgi:MFS family permease
VTPVRLGLRENLAQFSLLVAVNAFVGAMVGLERSTLPLVGEDDFGLGSSAAVLSFIVAFGLAKSFTNLAAGAGAERFGRRRLLILGWTLALPVPLLIAVAPSWAWIVAANLFLGVNQGLAWSMTVVMKIDLVGPKRRGLALGLNEAAGYGGVAVAAALSGWLASEIAPRDVLVAGGAGIALLALLLTVLFVRDTAGHVQLEQHQGGHASDETAPPLRQAFGDASYRRPALRACSQAGLVNNLNDALAWGLVPLFLAANGASASEVGLVAGLYPGVWGIAQIAAGHWSDRLGRKPLIVAGMLLQAAALALLAASDGALGLAARLSDPDRRHLRCRLPGRARPHRRHLPLLARHGLRRRRATRRPHGRRTRLQRRHRSRRRPHGRLRDLGRLRSSRAARAGPRAAGLVAGPVGRGRVHG